MAFWYEVGTGHYGTAYFRRSVLNQPTIITKIDIYCRGGYALASDHIRFMIWNEDKSIRPESVSPKYYAYSSTGMWYWHGYTPYLLLQPGTYYVGIVYVGSGTHNWNIYVSSTDMQPVRSYDNNYNVPIALGTIDEFSIGLYLFPSVTYTLATLYFTPNGGTFTGSVEVEIDHTLQWNGLVTIHYTTDGSTPDDDSTIYTSLLTFTEHTTLKARSFLSGFNPGPVATETYYIKIATPTFTPIPDTYEDIVEVVIATTNPGCAIYYTTDGLDPNQNSKLYTSAVILENPTTLKAIAYRDNNYTSDIKSGYYYIVYRVKSPVFNPEEYDDDQSTDVTITCATPDALIYFTTDGSDPTEIDTLYTSTMTVTETTLFKARAYHADYQHPSYVIQAQFYIRVHKPVFNPEAASYPDPIDVMITTTTTGVNLYYTLNKDTPDEGDTEYTGPVLINEDLWLKARGYKAGIDPSAVETGSYKIGGQVPTPVIDPDGGFYYTSVSGVTITCEDEDATIYYTNDGNDPLDVGWIALPEYHDTLTISGTTLIRARAMRVGFLHSNEATAQFIIQDYVPQPVFDPAPGMYVEATVTISCPYIQDEEIYYTIDGTDPTEADTLYTTPIVMPDLETTTLKARAFKSPWDPSPITSGDYEIAPLNILYDNIVYVFVNYPPETIS